MQSSETSTTNQVETPEHQETGGMDSLSELLAAVEPGDEETTEQPGGNAAESSGSEEQTKPTKFNDLAGATDLDLDALYKLEISLDDSAEPVTIEQLKDSYKQRSEFELERIEFAETRTQQEAELLRAKSELNDILQSLPKNAVRPDVLEKIRTKHEQRMQAERAKTLDAIQSWHDQEKRTADLAAMSEHLGQYGFPTDYLGQVQDHRLFPYIRDNMMREKRIREALAKVRNGKPEKAATSKPQKKAPSKGSTLDKVNKGSHPNKLAAVFSNID